MELCRVTFYWIFSAPDTDAFIQKIFSQRHWNIEAPMLWFTPEFVAENGWNSDVLMLSAQMEGGHLVPLLIAAGGGGNAYLEDPEVDLDQIPLEQYENDTIAPCTNGRTSAAGTIDAVIA